MNYNVILRRFRVNHFYYRNAIICSSFSIVVVKLAVESVGDSMEMQQWVTYALSSNNSIFRSTVNDVKVLGSSRRVPDTFVRF
jgi:hypothetical protein